MKALFHFQNLILILAFLCRLTELDAQPSTEKEVTVVIPYQKELISLNKSAYYLEDTSRELTINDVLKLDHQFKLNLDPAFIRPSSDSAYWFRFTIQNRTGKEAWIEIGNSLLWDIDYYARFDKNYQLITSTGALHSESSKAFPSNLFLLPLGVNANPQTIYIRVFTERRVNVNFLAGNLPALTNENLDYRTILTAFITIITILLFLNSFFLFISKNRSYLFYICYILTGLPGLLYLYNFPIQHYAFNESVGYFIVKHPYIWINIPFSFLSLLTIRLLNLESKTIARRILLFSAIYFLFLSPFIDYLTIHITKNKFPISQSLSIFNLIYIVNLGIYRWLKNKNWSLSFYILGWFSLLTGLTIHLSTTLGILNYNLINRSSLIMGTILECIFFSISIVSKSDIFQMQKVEDLRNKLDLNTEVFDSLSEYIAVTNLEGKILRVNQAWKKFKTNSGNFSPFIGIQEGTNYFEVIKHNTSDQIINRNLEALQGIHSVVSREVSEFNFEYSYQTENDLSWYLMNVSRLQGSNLGLVITHINITKRKITEIEKGMAKDLLNGALEAIAEGILITDGNQKILQFNQKYKMMFRVPESILTKQDETLLNQEMFKRIENPEESKARIEEIYLKKKFKSFDILKLKEGELFERYSHPLYHDSEIVGRVWSFRDVTARVEVTNDLFAWKRFITTVTDAIPGLVSYWTRDLKCTFANFRYEEWYGKSQSSIVGHHLRELQGEASYLANLPYIERVLNGEEVRYESINTESSNQDINLWTHFIPDKHSVTGNVVGFIILTTDITEIKMIQAEFEREKEKAETATKAKSDFLATMSHEIRTPLNGVIGFTDLLLQTELTEEQDRFLRIVSNSSMALLSLLNNILDFSKIEAGKLELNLSLGDIRSIAKQAIDVISFQAQEKSLKMIENYDESIPNLLFFDAVRLRQILINLLSNAVKFTKKGEIEVSIRTNSELSSENSATLEISIRDSGIGIPADKLKMIFEPFSQGDSSTTREYGGTGLGLAISNKLLAIMDSSLKVESEIDKGSIFSFVLSMPTAKNQLSSSRSEYTRGNEAERRLREENQKLKFLLVDDDEVNLFLLKNIIQNILPNAMISFASNGEIGLQEFKSSIPDLIFMDVHMPVLSGLDATKEIRNLPNGKTVPIIALTAASFQSDIERCLGVGMNDYAIKPFKKESIIQILEKWILNEARKYSSL